jgi:hypothetical protein
MIMTEKQVMSEMRVERVVNGFDSALRLHDDAMTMASIYV